MRLRQSALNLRFIRDLLKLPRASLLVTVSIVVSYLAISACSGDDSSPSTTAPDSTAGTSATTTAFSPAPTTDANDPLSAAQGILSDQNAARCSPPGPTTGCNILSLDPQPSEAHFNNGIAYFGVTGSAGETLTLVLGETPGGQWHLYLWEQQFYNPVHLPEMVTICAFGNGAAVHSAASTAADVVATLSDGLSVTTNQFVLNQIGTLPKAAPAVPGYGWYHLASPDGWVYSKYITGGPSCDLHDRLQAQ